MWHARIIYFSPSEMTIKLADINSQFLSTFQFEKIRDDYLKDC